MVIAIGLVLLALTVYTSTLSFALRSYSRARLSERLSESRQRLWFDRLDRHEAELQALIAFTRMTCTLATIGHICWALLSEIDPAQHRTALAGAIAAVLLVLLLAVVGVPNSLALHAGEAILARSLGVIWTLRTILYPIEKVLMAIDFVVRRLLGIRETTAEEESERHEQEILEAVTEGELHGAVDEEQKEMIESVFELSETPVSAIMTPRTDTIAISVDATAEEVQKTILEEGHSRVPVYEGSLDHIVGVLYAKDLIGINNRDFDIRKLLRNVPFVPETKTIDHLLRELRQQKVHIAIVLDEYGGTAGLITIEDIIEELIGEIDDEYDHEAAPTMQRVNENTLEVDARVHVDEVNEELDVEIPANGSYETVGGFVFSTLGRIPSAGDELDHDNIHIHVLDAEPRKINRLRITVDRTPEPV